MNNLKIHYNGRKLTSKDVCKKMQVLWGPLKICGPRVGQHCAAYSTRVVISVDLVLMTVLSEWEYNFILSQSFSYRLEQRLVSSVSMWTDPDNLLDLVITD